MKFPLILVLLLVAQSQLISKEITLVYNYYQTEGCCGLPLYAQLNSTQHWKQYILPENLSEKETADMLAEVNASVSLEFLGKLELGGSSVGALKLRIAEGSKLADLDLDSIFRDHYNRRVAVLRNSQTESVITFLDRELLKLKFQLRSVDEEPERSVLETAISDVEIRLKDIKERAIEDRKIKEILPLSMLLDGKNK